MKIIKQFNGFIIFLLIFLITPNFSANIFANTILLNENFDDNNPYDGVPTTWNEVQGSGNWFVQDGKYIGSVGPFTNPLISLTGNLNWKDYSLDVDVDSLEGVDRHILFRFTQYHVKGYSIKFRNEDLGVSGLIELQKHGQNVVLQTNTLFKTHIGESHHFKIVAIGNNIQVFVDDIQTPLINYTDTDVPILEGRVGFEVESAGINTITKTGYDNLVITDLSSTSLNMPNIKQYALPWGPQEYDNASNWKPAPLDKSMSRWGCAVTSTSMILQYYGHMINPEELNNWLKVQKDGYNREGHVMWPAIGRLTRIRSGPLNLPSLEFQYIGNNINLLSAEIDQERPAILKYSKNGGTHFVVEKGKTNNDYLVNDPASSVNTLLTQVANQWGTLTNIGRFTPSHTDLSYIVIFVDNDAGLTVYDNNGNIINDGYTLEEPIVDAVDNTLKSGSGQPLKAFYLPKPESGVYKVAVTGLGEYQLDTYLYDSEGNVSTQSYFNSLEQNQSTTFFLSLDKNNSVNSFVEEASFDGLLDSLDVARSNNLISSNGLYVSLHSLIKAGALQYEKGKVQEAIDKLNLAKAHLLNAKYSQIQNETRLRLMQQIDNLISIL